MESYMKIIKKAKYEELCMLRRFFKDCEDRVQKQGNGVTTCNSRAGTFGVGYSTFFGNAIQYNTFEIPVSAMCLIYRANKERIDKLIKGYEDETEE